MYDSRKWEKKEFVFEGWDTDNRLLAQLTVKPILMPGLDSQDFNFPVLHRLSLTFLKVDFLSAGETATSEPTLWKSLGGNEEWLEGWPSTRESKSLIGWAVASCRRFLKVDRKIDNELAVIPKA